MYVFIKSRHIHLHVHEKEACSSTYYFMKRRLVHVFMKSRPVHLRVHEDRPYIVVDETGADLCSKRTLTDCTVP